MWNRILALVVAGVISWSVGAARGDGEEVTLVGSLICNGACVAGPKEGDHYMVLFAIDGSPAVKTEVTKIMAGWPEKGEKIDAVQPHGDLRIMAP